jgi:hypothetical protein
MSVLNWHKSLVLGYPEWIRITVTPETPTDATYEVIADATKRPLASGTATIAGSIIGCLYTPTEAGRITVRLSYTISDQRFRVPVAAVVEA